MKERISEIIKSSIQLKQTILADDGLLNAIETITALIVTAYNNGNKVLFCGNGGSAADAQHLASELSGKFYLDRRPLYAEALHVNTSYLTATANDYSYEEVYARLVEAKGKKGDVLIGLSTSGNSANVVHALHKAKEMGFVTIGMSGSDGGKIAEHCDHLIRVPSGDTPRIQEAHILIGHIICEEVERALFA